MSEPEIRMVSKRIVLYCIFIIIIISLRVTLVFTEVKSKKKGSLFLSISLIRRTLYPLFTVDSLCFKEAEVYGMFYDIFLKFLRIDIFLLENFYPKEFAILRIVVCI